MKPNMVDMSNNGNDMLCSSMYDSKYSIGFFLNPKQVEALGITPDVEPETVMCVIAMVKVKSVTKRDGETECYMCVTEMGIATKEDKPSPSTKMAAAYGKEGDSNNGNG